MSSDKAYLEKTLGKLLGFDDGADDVLDHLLTIESEEDLLEYLSQLLGETTAPVLQFVTNVGRFNRSEKLDITEEEAPPDIEEKKEDPPERSAKSNLTTAGNPKKQTPSKKAAAQERRQKQSKSRVPPPQNRQQKDTDKSSTLKAPPPTAATANEGMLAASGVADKTSQEEKVEKSRPSRGKPQNVCGCFGTRHKPLTNCLYCGRISCLDEGYDYCPFCGFMVENVLSEGQVHDSAWIQKERLLRFDREFARRTEIFDDQADFHGPSTWMTEDERLQAEENEASHIESLKRPKQVLNLAL